MDGLVESKICCTNSALAQCREDKEVRMMLL